jgi:hypothetical protein
VDRPFSFSKVAFHDEETTCLASVLLLLSPTAPQHPTFPDMHFLIEYIDSSSLKVSFLNSSSTVQMQVPLTINTSGESPETRVLIEVVRLDSKLECG